MSRVRPNPNNLALSVKPLQSVVDDHQRIRILAEVKVDRAEAAADLRLRQSTFRRVLPQYQPDRVTDAQPGCDSGRPSKVAPAHPSPPAGTIARALINARQTQVAVRFYE